MALPPVQELEDNTGGVLRLKDGTPLPPYLAMPRGLPLTEWYALHRPRQTATLTMLAQVLFRLEKIHKSGYCHNDVKPANIVLLETQVGRPPAWHIVDFTNMAQIGAPRLHHLPRCGGHTGILDRGDRAHSLLCGARWCE